MKYLLLLLLSFNAYGDWSSADTNREAVWQTINLLDWGQTLDIVREQEAGESRYEQNPILGKNPSRGKVNTYFALSHLAHYGVSKWLTPDNRRNWQWLTIGVSGFVVYRNYYIGLKVNY